MEPRSSLYYLMTGTGNVDSDTNPFLLALSKRLPGASVFYRKTEWGTLERNFRGAREQLLEAIRMHRPQHVAVIGHSEGGIHALRLAGEIPVVDVAVLCATAVCTFRQCMLHQFTSPGAPRSPAVKKQVRAVLDSTPFVSPSAVPGPADRSALRAFFELLPPKGPEINADPDLFECCASYLPQDGRQLITEANRHKLRFVFAREDMVVPTALCMREIERIDPAIPRRSVARAGHSFLTKKRKASEAALRYVLGCAGP